MMTSSFWVHAPLQSSGTIDQNFARWMNLHAWYYQSVCLLNSAVQPPGPIEAGEASRALGDFEMLDMTTPYSLYLGISLVVWNLTMVDSVFSDVIESLSLCLYPGAPCWCMLWWCFHLVSVYINECTKLREEKKSVFSGKKIWYLLVYSGQRDA